MIKKAISQDKASGSDASNSPSKPKSDAKSKAGDKSTVKGQEIAKPVVAIEYGKRKEKLGENELLSIFLYFCIRGDKRGL